MTTALSIIERAYSLMGYKAQGEAVSADDADYALSALNDMLDGWNTQRFYIVTVNEVVTTVSGLPITIGPGQTIDVARPVALEDGAFVRINNVDFAITWVDRETYNQIPYKQVASNVPCYGYYDANMPTGNIYLWPYSVVGQELHLQLQEQLTEFADLTTDYDLAPGYRKALAYSLAEELSPGIREVSPMLMQKAAAARKAIRRTNVVVPLLGDGQVGQTPYARFVSGV